MKHSFKKVNNERSEAIELIKTMDSIVKRATWEIKTVGGESTLNTGSKRMFPDVFLYGDIGRTRVLQGWEVKMPDVPITDADFIDDAQRKADVLSVNSCFIWNFAFGVLYIKVDDSWEKKREWCLPYIQKRADVEDHKTSWEQVIREILVELNSFFQTGLLRSASIGDIISDGVFTAIIRRNQSLTAEHMRTAATARTEMNAFISLWWKRLKAEYRFDENDGYMAYAKYILLNWMNKFTFANMLKKQHNPADAVKSIAATTTPVDAVKIFREITRQCDFNNIFAEIDYADVLPEATWKDLTEFNAFLIANGIDDISQTALQSVLENTVKQFKRNIVGQFTTPEKLARLLVRAGIDNLTLPVIDPCCGTGTIAKAILEAKVAALETETAYKTTFASDKYSFPLQISNIALTRVSAMNLPALLFQKNAFSLATGDTIQIRNPQDGQMEDHTLPEWGSIVSNLPFVAFDQEEREESDNIQAAMAEVSQETSVDVSARADLYQALILRLWHTLADDAGAAVITSNSWLGTAAGASFFKALHYYYDIKSVIASGDGKWFDNADVIAVLLFLKKKSVIQPPSDTQKLHFGLVTKPLDDISDDEMMEIADLIKLQTSDEEASLKLRTWTVSEIADLLHMNISVNAMFYDVGWISRIKENLCPVTDLFGVFRGIKTGQDDFYYPKNISVVDREYVGRILMSGRKVDHLTARPDRYAFVCNKSLQELTRLGHNKTLNWIRNHQDHINQSVPNKETFWMNMADGRFSGSTPIKLFTPMNPERRFFYGLLEEPTVVNQRIIGLAPLVSGVNIELCHALLNTVLSAFYTEATGFPRGLGVLDIRKDGIEKVWMLDPRKLTAEQEKEIMAAFKPLLSRKILPFNEELSQKDRLHFEHTVLSCYQIDAYFDSIKAALLEMQRVRLSVKA